MANHAGTNVTPESICRSGPCNRAPMYMQLPRLTSYGLAPDEVLSPNEET